MCLLCICSCLSRCVLYVCNTFLILFGLGMLVLGCLFKVDKKFARNMLVGAVNSTELKKDPAAMDDLSSTLVLILNKVASATIAGGVIIMLISILGFCGACKRSRCYLYLYVLFIGFAAVIAGCVCVFTIAGMGQFRDIALKRTTKIFLNFGNETSHSGNAFNLMMKYFHCCGVLSGKDFTDLPVYWKTKIRKSNKTIVPKVCCHPNKACTTKPEKHNSNYETGCFTKFWDIFRRNSADITILLGVVTFVLFCIIVLACCVIKHENAKARDDD